jgi:DNA-cytosine methyltransferase
MMQRYIAHNDFFQDVSKAQLRTSVVLLLEDNSSAAERRRHAGVGSADAALKIKIRVHKVIDSRKFVAASKTYEAGSLDPRSSRIDLAVSLLVRASAGSRAVVVAGTSYGSAPTFLSAISKQQLSFVVQIRPSTVVDPADDQRESARAADFLAKARWQELHAVMPDGTAFQCAAATLGEVSLSNGRGLLFAAQLGKIEGVHRGTILGISSFRADLPDLLRLVCHSRWIRGAIRRGRRTRPRAVVGAEPTGVASVLTARANITLAQKQDLAGHLAPSNAHAEFKGRLASSSRVVNIVELFAGAGGMGLGFLLGGSRKTRYRIVHSAEANPIFVQTLRANHAALTRTRGSSPGHCTPEQLAPVDLRERRALDHAVATATDMGGADLVIGGPPCQGFSMANRNSWSGANPNNELVHVFIKYIQKLRPRAFLLENVQGILWTPKHGTSVSVVDVIEKRMKASGYILYPKLLDAAWYGVPQHRTRFFLLGLHRDLGYDKESFGEWGPFPRPTHAHGRNPPVTVLDAIGDLPSIGNGSAYDELRYREPARRSMQANEFLAFIRAGAEPGVISDHVTSRHADYVIKRYEKIPPGGNWEDIRETFTNYADVSRTHSNIYRRLRWSQPSITIGHYRKSMLVHPSQHRGLSLREACRLQSFPDWFRFAGTADGRAGGLVHKQQQLANAVCPLVTRAIADFIARL